MWGNFLKEIPPLPLKNFLTEKYKYQSTDTDRRSARSIRRAFAIASACAPPSPRALRKLNCGGAKHRDVYNSALCIPPSNNFRLFFIIIPQSCVFVKSALQHKKVFHNSPHICAKLWKTLWIMRKTPILLPKYVNFRAFVTNFAVENFCGASFLTIFYKGY